MRISDWSSDVCSSDLIRPESEAEARAVFDKWDLDFAVIGEVTETGRIVLTKDGAVQADIPVGPLVTEAPEYDRPHTPSPKRPVIAAAEVPAHGKPSEALARRRACPAMASPTWLREQYGHRIMGGTT